MSRVRLVRSSLPDAFALLARALEVVTERGALSFSGCWLAADPKGGTLLIGPDSQVQEIPGPLAAALPPLAVRLRGRFTGRRNDGRGWEIPRIPQEWDDLGAAESILYESDKINGGGTGLPELFRHEFSHGAKAYRAGDFLAIVGPRIKVDAAGIRN